MTTRYALTDTDIAYAAGLFDGEGNVSLHVTRGRPSLSICIVGQHRPMHDWLVERFGGYVYLSATAGKYKNRRDLFKWVLNGAEAADFLRLVLPYLREKRAQAEVVVDERLNWGQRYGVGNRIPAEVFSLRFEAKRLVTELKHV